MYIWMYLTSLSDKRSSVATSGNFLLLILLKSCTGKNFMKRKIWWGVKATLKTKEIHYNQHKFRNHNVSTVTNDDLISVDNFTQNFITGYKNGRSNLIRKSNRAKMKSIFVIVLALFVVMAMVPEINGKNNPCSYKKKIIDKIQFCFLLHRHFCF